ncbi:MAG: hypothetical protein M3R44_01840 [Candidatus Eremiobacteraeota bacterium]|nr:hypothetical protein [Candidatus Eremiobacteraeota bacterium]
MARHEDRSAAELHRVHVLLHEVAVHEDAPQRNIVRGAVKRLRARRTAIVHANEFLGVLVAVVRGWTTLLAIEGVASRDACPRTKQGDEDVAHG